MSDWLRLLLGCCDLAVALGAINRSEVDGSGVVGDAAAERGDNATLCTQIIGIINALLCISCTVVIRVPWEFSYHADLLCSAATIYVGTFNISRRPPIVNGENTQKMFDTYRVASNACGELQRLFLTAGPGVPGCRLNRGQFQTGKILNLWQLLVGPVG